MKLTADSTKQATGFGAGGGSFRLGFLHRFLVSAVLFLWLGGNPVLAQTQLGAHWCATCRTNPAAATAAGSPRLVAQGLVPAAFTPNNSIGTKKVLVLRVDFPDLPGTGPTLATITNNMAAVRAFYQTNSFNQLFLNTVDVVGILRMPSNSGTYGNADDNNLLYADAATAARAVGVEPNTYDFRIVAFTGPIGFAFAGRGIVGGSVSWIHMDAFDVGVVAHELGHNLGLGHPACWHSATVIGSGVDMPNIFEVMSSALSISVGLGSNFKRHLGWLGAGSIHTATTNNIYRIYAIDGGAALNPSRQYALRVPAAASGPSGPVDYWVECRQAAQSAAPSLTNGVLVSWGSEATPNDYRVLDTTPRSQDIDTDARDAALTLGRSFTDPNKQITIAPIARSGSGADTYVDVQVTFGSSLTPPNIAVQPQSQSVPAGATVTLSVSASSSSPFSIQWKRFGFDVAGGTNSTLTMTNITGGQAGDYFVVVSNALGSAVSDLAALVVTNAGVASLTPTPSPPGLIAWWNANGNAMDSVGVAHGTLLNGTRIATGLVGDAFNFDGIDDQVAIPVAIAPSFAPGSAFTLEAWVYRIDSRLPFHVLGKRATGPSYYQMGYDGGSPNVPLNAWTHLVDTYDGTNFQRFYNGALVQGYPRAYVTTNSADLQIGAAGGGGFFKGLIDDVRFYNRALSLTEIAEIYNAGTNGMILLTNAPVIVAQPKSQSLPVGASAIFSVTAGGAGGVGALSYQWLKNGVPMLGATSRTIVVGNLLTNDSGTSYSVTVSNSLGAVTSSSAFLTVTNVVVPVNAVQAPVGLVAWWPADNTTNDRIGTNHGSVLNGGTFAPGYVAQAFAFDGVDDFVSAPDSAAWAFGTNEFSIELWANFSALNGHRAMVANDEGGGLQNKWIFWRHSTGVLQLQVNYPGGGTSIGSYAFTPALGAWYHLAITRAGNVFTLYVNGVAVQAVTNTVSIPNANSALTIGQAENAFYFGGLLDDVRIYNRALAALEIQAIYAAGTNGMAPPARPSLSSQPGGQTLLAGTSATFSVQAAGSTPLRYQWLREGSPISGATNAVYTIATAQVSDAGNYSVIVTNALGTVTSSNAVLAVYAAPQIFAQPLSQPVLAGQNVVLSVAATGSPAPEYRWRYNGVSIAGATNSVLSLPNVAFGQSGTYSVLVSNLVGTVASANAVLTVLSPPVITTGAQSQTVLSGSTVTLSVAATGSPPLSYQWRKDGVNIGGATGTNHTLSNLQTNQTGTYSVVVSNAYGTVTNSALITVTPGPLAPAIVTQPQSQTVRAGTNVTFTVLATGYPTPDYQWVKNGVAVSGVNAPSLSLTNVGLADAGNYYVQIYNVSGVTNSAVATLTVHTLPTFTTQPQPTAVVPGNVAVFTVAVDGVPTPALSWFKDGVRLTNSAGISGATTATLLAFVSGANQAGSYFAVATNAAGATTSSVVSLTVLLPPTITQQPTNVVLLRTNPASVLPALFSVSAAGTAPLSYQWRFNGGSLPNQTNPTLALPNVARADGGSYSVVVTNQVGSATSTNALLRVRVPQRLLVPERLGDGRLRLVFADDLGTLATGSDQPFVEVQFATNMVGTNFAWQRLTNAIVTTNGALQIEEPPSLAVPRRFYRVIER